MSDNEKDRLGNKLREVEKGRENKFFAERDAQLLAKLKAKAGAHDEEVVRELTHNRCPRCGEHLAKRSHLEVHVERCPKGHGVWLDDGELDKLVQRESTGWLARFLGRPD